MTISEAFSIAIQHHQAGRLEAAEQIYRSILAAEPNHADALHLVGVIASQTGNHEAAVDYIERAVKLNGEAAFFHNNLGEAYRALGRFSAAVSSYRRALDAKPDLAEAHCNLGQALWTLEMLDEAVTSCRRAIELTPDNAKAFNNLGNALKDQGELDEALAAYRRALELKPEFDEAHVNLGRALAEIGDLHGTERAYRAALQYNPRFAFAHSKLAELLRGKLPDNDLAEQRRLLERPEQTETQRLFLHFGLAQVLDARGEYAEAARHAAHGNTFQTSEWQRRGKKYVADEHELFASRMMEICESDFFERVRGFGSESELPIFVVGLPRSGTTLVEQILAHHPQICGAGETKLSSNTMAALGIQSIDSFEGLRSLSRETSQHLASQHLNRLRKFDPGANRIVDKTPDNYLYLGLLACLFPRAKFIHCRRDLRDVAVSCWMTHFHEIRWSNEFEHIVSRFAQHQRLMEHWRNVLPTPLLEVDYEETVGNLEGVARRLVAWCGLEWEESCVRFYESKRAVKTVGAVQVRQPIFKTSVGRWRHYEQELGPLFAELQKIARPSDILTIG